MVKKSVLLILEHIIKVLWTHLAKIYFIIFDMNMLKVFVSTFFLMLVQLFLCLKYLLTLWTSKSWIFIVLQYLFDFYVIFILFFSFLLSYSFIIKFTLKKKLLAFCHFWIYSFKQIIPILHIIINSGTFETNWIWI